MLQKPEVVTARPRFSNEKMVFEQTLIRVLAHGIRQKFKAIDPEFRALMAKQKHGYWWLNYAA
jgi:hypothetical protein